ncbi:glutamate ABC transporter substrate-binding protein [Streptomyces sp. SBT349]|uniref:glutamate ABC transporter substrate-binding protein n=1 Tax=Streptomyces sp. SBT349 TaxID=1580539 RepID=UPI00069CCDA6|nr:glutamate ABC transporter substrate-binding protein [Streptomyces sp. SBT349]
MPENARRGRRSPDARALLLAAAGLALAGTVLAGSLPPPVRGGAHPSPHAVAEQAQDDVRSVAERERCGDGEDEWDAAASLPADRVAGPAVDEIQERGQLVVGIDQNSYLWGYRSPENGEIVGFDIDLVEAIAEDLLNTPDPNVKFLAIPTSERENAIRNGDVDMVVRTMSITCERWEKVAFSTAYFETGQQLLVPRNSSIEGFDASLEGMKVCSAEGSTAEDLLREQTHGAELVPAPNHLDCLVRVQLGEADALMTDSALAAGHVAQDPSMRLVGEPLTEESYGVAMNLANTDLVAWVNAVLEDYRDGGTQSRWTAAAEARLEGYLYPEDDPPPAPPEPLYRD